MNYYKKILLLVSILLTIMIADTIAQNNYQYSNWILGRNTTISFNNGLNVPISHTNKSNSDAFEGTSSISDTNGSLLMFTNGVQVWNRNFELMPYSKTHFIKSSSSATQNALIIPISNNKYYLFTTPDSEYDLDRNSYLNGLNYSVIDMDLDNGNGDVTTTELLFSKSCEKLAALKTSSYYWICAVEWNSNTFHLYKVNDNGIVDSIVNKVGQIHKANKIGKSESVGELKFSPSGNKIAYVNSDSKTLEVFNFDTTTGKMSEYYSNQFEDKDSTYTYLYGCTFSPNGSKLYFTYSYNISTTEIMQLDIENLYLKSIYKSENEQLYGLQIAADENIYVSKINTKSNSNLDVIYESNSENPKYVKNGLHLNDNSNTWIGSYNYPISIYKPNLANLITDDTTFIPNAFTPNMDGINDEFNPIKTLNIKDDITYYNLSIFNRYGKLVFQTNNVNEAWKGEFKQTNYADEGMNTYYYALKINTNKQEIIKKGDITIVW